MLADIVGKFNQQASAHQEKQSLNPFSGRFSRSPSPRPRDENYGRPVAGSLTDIRGQKAKTHILREILELCTCIHDVAMYNLEQKKRHPDYEPDPDEDGTLIVTFGELFQIYTKINDKVVGLLIAAKKRGFVYFEKEILFQRRDDDVLIALIKPIHEIQDAVRQSMTPSPNPSATPSAASSRSVSPVPEEMREEAEEKRKKKSSTKKEEHKKEEAKMAQEVVEAKKPEVVESNVEIRVDAAEEVKKEQVLEENREVPKKEASPKPETPMEEARKPVQAAQEVTKTEEAIILDAPKLETTEDVKEETLNSADANKTEDTPKVGTPEDIKEEAQKTADAVKKEASPKPEIPEDVKKEAQKTADAVHEAHDSATKEDTAKVEAPEDVKEEAQKTADAVQDAAQTEDTPKVEASEDVKKEALNTADATQEIQDAAKKEDSPKPETPEDIEQEAPKTTEEAAQEASKTEEIAQIPAEAAQTGEKLKEEVFSDVPECPVEVKLEDVSGAPEEVKAEGAESLERQDSPRREDEFHDAETFGPHHPSSASQTPSDPDQ